MTQVFEDGGILVRCRLCKWLRLLPQASLHGFASAMFVVVLVEKLRLRYHKKDTMLFTTDPYYSVMVTD